MRKPKLPADLGTSSRQGHTRWAIPGTGVVLLYPTGGDVTQLWGLDRYILVAPAWLKV